MSEHSNWINEIPIAHRGLHDENVEIAENSLFSFEKAIANNYAIEIDVMLSKDNEIIVFHDSSLFRSTGNSTKVSSLTLEELKHFNLFNTKSKIPTLSETLNTIMGKVPVLIELKNFSFNRGLEKKLIIELDKYKGPFALQSFNPLSVIWLKRKRPNFMIGQLAGKISKIRIINQLFLNKYRNPDFIAFDINYLPNKTVAYFKEKKKPILGWTIKTLEQSKKAKVYCDNIIFEKIKPDKYNGR